MSFCVWRLSECFSLSLQSDSFAKICLRVHHFTLIFSGSWQIFSVCRFRSLLFLKMFFEWIIVLHVSSVPLLCFLLQRLQLYKLCSFVFLIFLPFSFFSSLSYFCFHIVFLSSFPAWLFFCFFVFLSTAPHDCFRNQSSRAAITQVPVQHPRQPFIPLSVNTSISQSSPFKGNCFSDFCPF